MWPLYIIGIIALFFMIRYIARKRRHTYVFKGPRQHKLYTCPKCGSTKNHCSIRAYNTVSKNYLIHRCDNCNHKWITKA
jgi:transcription elongation factor Elf1